MHRAICADFIRQVELVRRLPLSFWFSGSEYMLLAAMVAIEYLTTGSALEGVLFSRWMQDRSTHCLERDARTTVPFNARDVETSRLQVKRGLTAMLSHVERQYKDPWKHSLWELHPGVLTLTRTVIEYPPFPLPLQAQYFGIGMIDFLRAFSLPRTFVLPPLLEGDPLATARHLIHPNSSRLQFADLTNDKRWDGKSTREEVRNEMDAITDWMKRQFEQWMREQHITEL